MSELLEQRYTTLVARPTPTVDVYERPLSSLETGFFHASYAAAGRGVRGFAAMRTGMRVDGAIDLSKLVQALEVVVQYHDTMRTTYVGREGAEPVARVHAKSLLPVRVVDCNGDEAKVDAVLAEESTRGFDLAVGPMHRFVVIRIGAERHIIAHFSHHIACDGASYVVIFRDLNSIYAALCAGEPAPPRPPRRPSYTDYAEWQHRAYSATERAEHAAFWNDQLTGLQPAPMKSIGARRLSETPRRWKMTKSQTEPEVGLEVTAFAAERGCSPANVFLAGLLLMQHAEGAGDATLGYVSGNRRRETMRVVGMFAVLLPIHVSSTRDITFLELLARIERTIDRALDCQELAPEFHPIPEPPFRLVFNYSGRPEGMMHFANLPSPGLFSFEKERTLFDLWLNVDLMRDGRVQVRAECAVDLIDDAQRQGYVDRYAAVLRRAVAHPDQTIDELVRGLA